MSSYGIPRTDKWAHIEFKVRIQCIEEGYHKNSGQRPKPRIHNLEIDTEAVEYNYLICKRKDIAKLSIYSIISLYALFEAKSNSFY